MCWTERTVKGPTCPWYDGSVRLSGYPTIPVVKTTLQSINVVRSETADRTLYHFCVHIPLHRHFRDNQNYAQAGSFHLPGAALLMLLASLPRRHFGYSSFSEFSNPSSSPTSGRMPHALNAQEVEAYSCDIAVSFQATQFSLPVLRYFVKRKLRSIVVQRGASVITDWSVRLPSI